MDPELEQPGDALPHGLAGKISAVPESPGCYLYKDATGRVIYVGKAKSLRKRVASYFQRSVGHPARTLRLVQEVVDIEVLPTDSEVTVQSYVSEIDDSRRLLKCDGLLSVDGRIIYQMKNFTLQG